MKTITLVISLATALTVSGQVEQPEHFRGEVFSAKIGILSRLRQVSKREDNPLQKASLLYTPKYGSQSRY